MSKRERLARTLRRVGASTAILRARRRLNSPSLSVLTYHSVGDVSPDYAYDADVIDATPTQFENHLRILAAHCRVISLDELLAAVAGAPLPPNAALITFDDGYRSNLTVALPLLQKFGFTAVFFAATDFVQHRRASWWDRVNYIMKKATNQRFEIAYPEARTLDLSDVAGATGHVLRLVKDTFGLDVERFLDELAGAAGVEWTDATSTKVADELIMTWDDLRAMRDAGMYIQSHTRRHRVLGTLEPDDLADELTGSRQDIERELETPVQTVAYPVGAPIAADSPMRPAIVNAGYKIGFSNATGVNNDWRKLDPFDVSRFAMDRSLSDDMFLGQLAVPQLRYH